MDQKERASGRYVGKAEQPLTENKFGKLSRLSLRTGLREDDSGGCVFYSAL